MYCTAAYLQYFRHVPPHDFSSIVSRDGGCALHLFTQVCLCGAGCLCSSLLQQPAEPGKCEALLG